MLKNGHMQREFPLFGPLQTMERYYNDVFGSYIDQIFAHNGSFPMLQADSSCGCQNRGDANEVVGGGRENEEPFNQVATTVPSLAEATNVFNQPNGSSAAYHRPTQSREGKGSCVATG